MTNSEDNQVSPEYEYKNEQSDNRSYSIKDAKLTEDDLREYLYYLNAKREHLVEQYRKDTGKVDAQIENIKALLPKSTRGRPSGSKNKLKENADIIANSVVDKNSRSNEDKINGQILGEIYGNEDLKDINNVGTSEQPQSDNPNQRPLTEEELEKLRKHNEELARIKKMVRQNEPLLLL